MKEQEVIRFGHLRELIDAGKQLTDLEKEEYARLLPLVKRDVPHGETAIMKEAREKVEMLQRLADLERKIEMLAERAAEQALALLIAQLPALIAGVGAKR